jgi:hypothetical protein
MNQMYAHDRSNCQDLSQSTAREQDATDTAIHLLSFDKPLRVRFVVSPHLVDSLDVPAADDIFLEKV